jgi:hypothetical protein
LIIYIDVTTVNDPPKAELSGIERLRAAFAAGGAPIGRLLGMEVESLEVGRPVLALVPGERHYTCTTRVP